MRLEAVTCCVNYSDFLVETLPLNKPHFDYMVVVTTPEDEATQRVCEFYQVHCVQTDAFGPPGEFHKGRAINVGLSHLTKSDWVVHLDADVALPPLTRQVLQTADLNPSMLYGIDRFDVQGYAAWRKFLRRPRLQHENNAYVHMNGFGVSTRFVTSSYGGYVPIGFFQLWSPTRSGVTTYPENHSNAGRTDMLFAANWPRSRRALVPEVVAYHLESLAGAAQGANWAGRRTPPFEPIGKIGRWRAQRRLKRLGFEY